jgi:hypothetical protein
MCRVATSRGLVGTAPASRRNLVREAARRPRFYGSDRRPSEFDGTESCAPPRSTGEPAAQGREHEGRAQTGQTPRAAKRDVHGMSVAMPWAGAMGFAVIGSPRPTLGGRPKRQCDLPFHWRGVFVTYYYTNCNRITHATNGLLTIGAFARVKMLAPSSAGPARSGAPRSPVDAHSVVLDAQQCRYIELDCVERLGAHPFVTRGPPRDEISQIQSGLSETGRSFEGATKRSRRHPARSGR